jgi:hypothetical protein
MEHVKQVKQGIAGAALFAFGLALVIVVARTQAAPTPVQPVATAPSDGYAVSISTPGPGFPPAQYGPIYTSDPGNETPFPGFAAAEPTPRMVPSCPPGGSGTIARYDLIRDRFGTLECCPTYVSDKYIPVAGPQCIPPTLIPAKL